MRSGKNKRWPNKKQLSEMTRYVLLHLRYFIYGAISFMALGYLMEISTVGNDGVSTKLIGYLGLAGGISFYASSISCHVLYLFIKDLIYGNT